MASAGLGFDVNSGALLLEMHGQYVVACVHDLYTYTKQSPLVYTYIDIDCNNNQNMCCMKGVLYIARKAINRSIHC